MDRPTCPYTQALFPHCSFIDVAKLLLCLHLTGKTKVVLNKPQQEQIADLKATYLQFFSEFPVQKAGADFIGRSVDTIQARQRDDPDFSANVSRAKTEWAQKASRRVRPDNLLTNLYHESKPSKQESSRP
jgi:hypothetical protein